MDIPFSRYLTSAGTALGLSLLPWAGLGAQNAPAAQTAAARQSGASAAAKPDESRFTPIVLIPHGELDEPMVLQVLPDERVLIIER